MAAYTKSSAATGATTIAAAGTAVKGAGALDVGAIVSRLGQTVGFAGLGALAGSFWLLSTTPAGGDSEREFERMVNANQAAKGKTDVAGGEKAAGAAATGPVVQEGGKSDIKRPPDVPENWEEKPARKGGGIKWTNPENPQHDYVRGKADGTYTQVRDGKAYDAAGNKVDTDSPAAHGITLDDFVFRPGRNK